MARKDKLKKEKAVLSESFSLSKSDFGKHFLYYFGLILILVVIAYGLSVLPSLLSNNQSYNGDLSIDSNGESSFNLASAEIFEGECNISLTGDSKDYNLIYRIVSNGSEIGTIDYSIQKQGSGYLRTVDYNIDFSKVLDIDGADNMSADSAYVQSFYSSVQRIKLLYYYDSSFNCINSSYVMSMGGEEYTQPYSCVSYDVPFRVCMENLNKTRDIEIQLAGETIQAEEYVMKDSGHSNSELSELSTSEVLLTFSDLPFPITVVSPQSQLELVSYSKMS